jgi:hypothetical protein
MTFLGFIHLNIILNQKKFLNIYFILLKIITINETITT